MDIIRKGVRQLPVLTRSVLGSLLSLIGIAVLWLATPDILPLILYISLVLGIIFVAMLFFGKLKNVEPNLDIITTDLDGVVHQGGSDTLVTRIERFSKTPSETLYQLRREAIDLGTSTRVVNGCDGTAAHIRVEYRETNQTLEWDVSVVPVEMQSQALQFDCVQLPVILLDPDGTIVWANTAAGYRTGDTLAVMSQIDQLHTPEHQTNQTWRVLSADESDGGLLVIFDPQLGQRSTVVEIDDLIRELPIPIARLKEDGEIILANDVAAHLIGQPLEAGVMIDTVLEGMGPRLSERISKVSARRGKPLTEAARIRHGVADRFVQLNLSGFEVGGEPSVLMSLSDATELKTMEAQFVQSQKMQAVGQLAGGVAHDFNNLLTAISGHCDLLLMRHDVGDVGYGDLMQVRENTNRAAALVRQLLAFSRKQTLQPKQLDLWDTLGDLSHLLNRLIGANVSLSIQKGEDIPTVRVDERQFEQVVMNLVVNARDAMPNGGKINLNARGITLSEPLKRDRVTVPVGDYALVEVADNGAGIEPEVLRKIFEPFFTTKGPGRGTGLGLSTVYGIVKQSGGYVFVDSSVGEGTIFSLYLPAVTEVELKQKPIIAVPQPSRDVTGRGTILLVEDEVPVRTFAKRALEMRGYTVHEAGTGEDAIDMLHEAPEFMPDIVLSDVVMPGMDGPAWIEAAGDRLGSARIIFMSGYAEDAFEGKEMAPTSRYLAKPFSLSELVLTVKEQLESIE